MHAENESIAYLYSLMTLIRFRPKWAWVPVTGERALVFLLPAHSKIYLIHRHWEQGASDVDEGVSNEE